MDIVPREEFKDEAQARGAPPAPMPVRASFRAPRLPLPFELRSAEWHEQPLTDRTACVSSQGQPLAYPHAPLPALYYAMPGQPLPMVRGSATSERVVR